MLVGLKVIGCKGGKRYAGIGALYTLLVGMVVVLKQQRELATDIDCDALCLWPRFAGGLAIGGSSMVMQYF